MNDYIKEIYNKYIQSVNNKQLRNIAIIDGENLHGYDILTKNILPCHEPLYNPILDVLTKSKAIDKNSLIFIINKRYETCTNQQLQFIKSFADNVYLFSIAYNNVAINLNNNFNSTILTLNQLSNSQLNDTRNHYIKGFDDFIGFYIFAYLYQISQNEINSISFYTGDNLTDVSSYINNKQFYINDINMNTFNFGGFYQINIYSANTAKYYTLYNTQEISNLIENAEKKRTKSTIPNSAVCEYFKRSGLNPVRICATSHTNLQIHILGNSDRQKVMLRGLGTIFEPLSSFLTPSQPMNEINPNKPIWYTIKKDKQFIGNNKKNYYAKYLKYKTKYHSLKKNLIK